MIWLIAILAAVLLFGWGYLRGFIQMGISTVGFLFWLLALVPWIGSRMEDPDPLTNFIGTELLFPFFAAAALAVIPSAGPPLASSCAAICSARRPIA